MFFHALTFAGSRGSQVFEHKADRPSAQTFPEGPGKCLCNEINMCDRNIFLHILPNSNQIRTENTVK